MNALQRAGFSFRARLICGLVLLALAACGGTDQPAGPGGNPPPPEGVSELVGVYDLNTVAGEPLPRQVGFGLSEVDGMPVQVFTTLVAATLSLELDRSFSAEDLLQTEIFTLDGQKILDETESLPRGVGTWSCPSSCLTSVTLQYSAGTVETGTVEPGLLTFVRDGSAWVFERR